jgi:O-antigen/teichoic acid export membrane protein
VGTRTFLKNSGIVGTSMISSKAIKMLASVLLTRWAGIHEWGLYSAMAALAALVTTVSDLGIHNLVVRGIARNDKMAHDVFRGGVKARTVCFVISTLLIVPFLKSLFSDDIQIILFILIFAGSYMDGLCDIYLGAIRGREQFKIDLILSLLSSGLILTGSLVLIYSFPPSTVSIAALYACISLFTVFAYYNFLPVELKLRSPSRIPLEIRFYISTLHESLGSTLLQITSASLIATQTILLAYFASSSDAGLFSINWRITAFLLILPVIILITLAPKLYKQMGNNAAISSDLPASLLTLLTAGVFILTLLCIIFSKDILFVIYGQSFLSADSSLRILLLTLYFYAPCMLLQNLIFSRGIKIPTIKLFMFATLLSILLGIIGLRYNTSAASAAIVVIIHFLLYLYYLWKSELKLLSQANLMVLSGGIILLTTLYIQANFFNNLIIAALILGYYACFFRCTLRSFFKITSLKFKV